MEETLEVGATFPAPPHYYARYTARNLRLLGALQESGPDALVGEPDLPEWDIGELEPPRADWIVEEGYYESFGDLFPIPSRTMSLPEAGVVQLYDLDARDRRPALHSLLRTLLYAYHSLLTSLLSGPPLDPPPEGDTVYNYTEWMMAAGFNMMHAVNSLRGMQARIVLEGLMRARVEERKKRVEEVRLKCKTLREDLARLREKATRLSHLQHDVPPAHTSTATAPAQAAVEPQPASKGGATIDDVARWVDEV